MGIAGEQPVGLGRSMAAHEEVGEDVLPPRERCAPRAAPPVRRSSSAFVSTAVLI